MCLHKKEKIVVSATVGLVLCLLSAWALTGFIFAYLTNYQQFSNSVVVSDERLIQAQSGSVADIQEAIDLALTEGVGGISIPTGNWLFDADGTYHVSFNVPASGFKIQGAGINQTILYLGSATSATASGTIMFEIFGTSGGKLEVTGVTFRGRGDSNIPIGAGDIGVRVVSCKDFRIHHCRFDGKLGDAGISAVAVDWMGGNEAFGCKGVIDHCEFADIWVQKTTQRGTGWAYGVYVGWYADYNPSLWVSNVWSIAGKYDEIPFVIYVEDSTVGGVRHAIVTEHGGIFVFRHNVVTDIVTDPSVPTSASVDHHPYRSYGDGCRWGEVYNNQLNDQGLWIGSGGGLWFNNIIDSNKHAYFLQQGETSDSNCYPRCAVKDLYIWGNTVINAPGGTYYINNAGRIDPVYYQRAPSALLGETDYEPYVYPHPLTLG